MTGVALLMALATLYGGVALIRSGSKKITPITFPNSFYEELKYFKLDKNTVTAIREDSEKNEELFEGTVPTATKYYNQVQKGFEDWLETHDHFDKSDSTVTFK